MAKGAATAARRRRKEKIHSTRGGETAPSDDGVDIPMPELPGAEANDASAAPPAAGSGPVKKRRKVSEEKAAIAADDAINTIDTIIETIPTAVAKKCTKATKTGKVMNTYEPDVEMTKEQLAAWRREARRVRNRESAAASRRKTKERIEELEKEVNDYKSKYEEALAKLAQYEGDHNISV